MHLKRLELQGFKTFAERTDLEFAPGLTAGIGPNGSRKSKIADAVPWVLGEGRSDAILGVRAGDRRAIFEEAAGIKKYRHRKREAERKLEATDQNLLRIADIVAEIEGQLGPLARQASAARRYGEIAARL